jgi:YD repeat-containing protein
LNSIDNVGVTGNVGGPWTITFGGSQANTNVAKMNGDASNSTSGTLERTISYQYDVANQLTAANDPDSAYSYTYDNLGRVLTVDNDDTPGVPRVLLTNTYNANSNRTSLSATIDTTADFPRPRRRLLRPRPHHPIRFRRRHVELHLRRDQPTHRRRPLLSNRRILHLRRQRQPHDVRLLHRRQQSITL